MKILVFGASGMLGNAMIRVLSENKDWEVYGTVRSDDVKPRLPSSVQECRELRQLTTCQKTTESTMSC